MTPQAWISTIVLLLFVAATLLLFFYPVPPESKEMVYAVVSLLGALAGTCVNYYVGSSSNSARKTEIMAAQKRGGE